MLCGEAGVSGCKLWVSYSSGTQGLGFKVPS